MEMFDEVNNVAPSSEVHLHFQSRMIGRNSIPKYHASVPFNKSGRTSVQTRVPKKFSSPRENDLREICTFILLRSGTWRHTIILVYGNISGSLSRKETGSSQAYL